MHPKASHWVEAHALCVGQDDQPILLGHATSLGANQPSPE